eukprot:m.588472 g.588472  ORF g.588472 m.588472 type:complete len:72 (+) comp22365_c0_seq3:263-478(+)
MLFQLVSISYRGPTNAAIDPTAKLSVAAEQIPLERKQCNTEVIFLMITTSCKNCKKLCQSFMQQNYFKCSR